MRECAHTLIYLFIQIYIYIKRKNTLRSREEDGAACRRQIPSEFGVLQLLQMNTGCIREKNLGLFTASQITHHT